MEDYSILLQEWMNRASKLTEWERDFLISIEAQSHKGNCLSPEQVEKLKVIWERVN